MFGKQRENTVNPDFSTSSEERKFRGLLKKNTHTHSIHLVVDEYLGHNQWKIRSSAEIKGLIHTSPIARGLLAWAIREQLDWNTWAPQEIEKEIEWRIKEALWNITQAAKGAYGEQSAPPLDWHRWLEVTPAEIASGKICNIITMPEEPGTKY